VMPLILQRDGNICCMTKIDAVILAAGYGSRMRPITNDIPKVLLPILGEPCIVRILRRIQRLKPQEVMVNLHYKGNLIRETLGAPSDKITFVSEEQILGTGGALLNMRDLFKSDIILVHNGDIYTELLLEELINHFEKGKTDVLLAVSKGIPRRNLKVSDDLLTGIESGQLYGFTGIAVYRRGVLEGFEYGHMDIKDIWLQVLKKGYRIGIYDIGETFWSDLGSAEGYARTVFYILKKCGENLFVNKAAQKLPDVEFDGYFVVEGDFELAHESFVRNVIMLPNSGLYGGHYENCVISPSGSLEFDEITVMGGAQDSYLVGHGGSDREFIRIFGKEGSRIMCDYGKDVEGFNKHLRASELLKGCGVPVPVIFETDALRNRILMEDLGDTTLYTFLNYPPNRSKIYIYYKKAVEILVRLHTIGPTLRVAQDFSNSLFDYDYFKWEQGYFFNNFVSMFQGLEIPEQLDRELDHIAKKCADFKRVILHRDFQSQNLMVKPQGQLAVVDFSGLRLGPRSYDLASLLYDPYFSISEDVRKSLLEEYVQRCNDIGNDTLDLAELNYELDFVRIQRHMQALGAYGYLSRVKSKRYFEKFMMPGLNLLLSDVDNLHGTYPVLFLLISRLFNLLLDIQKRFEYN